MSQKLTNKLSYIIMKSLNEARVHRTIPTKVWATVSSVISKKYRQDKGVNAKPFGVPEVLLQKYVAGIILFKAQCPRSEKEMITGEVFPLWANAIVDSGYGVNDVIKLYNENTGSNIPYSETSAVPDALDVVGMPNPEPEIIEPEAEPVPAPKRREYAPAPEPVKPEDGYEFTAELRTDDPTKGIRGYRTTPYESYIIPYSEGDLDTVWEKVVNKYNSMKYKTKCRSGVINVKLVINLYDIEQGHGYQGVIQREGKFQEYNL